MGKKAKTSRKGKKAWRGNISTEDIDDFFEKSTKDALYGGSLASVPASPSTSSTSPKVNYSDFTLISSDF
ncbi:Ribosome biogenesis protein NOP53 [Quillaja saponaria]|uniref:Ribosome biogenesis protein NOP53 n=1 Tax=Quillaja saponaria TaxID=32244 RepID=A0AAD7LK00_QUISA|nr:Ribosome biogenesis protein NOP53 [Quillaja saponaria]